MSQKPQVMVVDDDLAMCGFLQTFLGARGYGALTITNSDEAVRRFHAERPSAVLLDVIMPGMDGRELAERMMRARPDTRILFMSGYAEPPIPDDILLQKPVTPDTLARKVAEVLHQPALAG